MELTQHVSDLAAAFKVRLDVRPGMPSDFAGAGYVIIHCPQCGQRNSLRHAGTVRCGKCKHPLGRHMVNQTIMIAPVVDETTYAIALHEMGHCLHPTGRVTEFEGSKVMRARNEVATLRDMRLQLLEEESAWEWAEANALRWTPDMQAVKDRALGSYRKFARQLGIK